MAGLTDVQRKVLRLVGWTGPAFDAVNERYDALMAGERGVAPRFAKVVQGLLARRLIRLSHRDEPGGPPREHLWLTDAGAARLSESLPPSPSDRSTPPPRRKRRRGR
jgi:hypothetical protein